MTPPGTPTSTLGPQSRFAATRWSVVVAAGDWRGNPAAHRAMGELAQIYWFPLYAYLRRKGNPPPQAEDLVQGFFARLLEKDALATVDRAKGKFRSFLLAAMKNYLANEWDKKQAQKRGGGRGEIALGTVGGWGGAEERYAAEPVDQMTPERVYERRWALAVLEQVLGRLREEYTCRGQGEIFAALEHLLVGGRVNTEPDAAEGGAIHEVRYAPIAARLGMRESAIKVAGHRLRQRYRKLLRAEIGQTVSDPQLVDEEIRQLLGSL